MRLFIQSVVDAVSLGALYALEALGVGLIFGIMRLANFALGAVVMACGYALYLSATLPLPVSLAVTAVIGMAMSLLTERLVFRPLRRASEATLFIASFAVAFGLQNLALLIFGPRPKPVVVSVWLTGATRMGGLVISHVSAATIVIVVVLLVMIVMLLRLTGTGIRMRAASDDFTMARLLGVRANHVIAIAFMVSGVLSAAAAVIVVAQTGGVSPGIGTTVVIVALLGAVIGGLDNLVGATIGGFLIGATVSLMNSWLPFDLRPFRDAFAAGVVILVLVLRPEGIVTGGTMRERV